MLAAAQPLALLDAYPTFLSSAHRVLLSPLSLPILTGLSATCRLLFRFVSGLVSSLTKRDWLRTARVCVRVCSSLLCMTRPDGILEVNSLLQDLRDGLGHSVMAHPHSFRPDAGGVCLCRRQWISLGAHLP